MKKSLLLLASAISALVLPGCFQHETTIHLKKDGSGTLVEETRLGAQMLAMLDQMAAFGGGGNQAPADPTKDMFSEEKAKKRAAELGEGVTLEKVEPANANGTKGARMTYQFKDINKIKVSTGDGMKNMSPGAGMPGFGGAAPTAKQEPVAFSYADGKLTIRMPETAKPDKAELPAAEGVQKPDMTSPEAQAMVKQMLGDMKMSMKIVIEPGIANTNATHQSGNTITLMDMDMGKLIEKADTLKKLGEIDQNDPNAAMETLKGLDGVTVETKKEVTVTVK